MGTDQNTPLSYPASTDLSASRYCAVVLNSDGELALPSAGGNILGILYNKPSSQGTAGLVKTIGDGQLKAKLGGTVAKGDKCKVDSSGRFVTASGADIAAGSAVALCTEGGGVGEIGSVVLFGAAGTMALVTASESPSGAAGNYNLDEYVAESLLTLGTANRTGALDDGLFVGQRKRIRVIAASGGFTYALTPTTMQAGQPTSFTFTAVGQMIELTWASDGWVVTEIKTAGVAAVAAAGTVNPLVRLITMALAGASEDRILPNGYVPGHTIGFVISGDTGGDTTVSGLFYDEDGSADGVDLQMADAGDMATVQWDGARWVPIQLVSTTVA